MTHVLYLVAMLHGIVTYQAVDIAPSFSQCETKRYAYQRENGHRGSFACMPEGWSIAGYPVASR